MDLAAVAAAGARATQMHLLGLLEQLADVGRSDIALRRQNNHATIWSRPTRQSEAQDSELLQVPIPLFLAGNTTPTIPHNFSKHKGSGFPMQIRQLQAAGVAACMRSTRGCGNLAMTSHAWVV